MKRDDPLFQASSEPVEQGTQQPHLLHAHTDSLQEISELVQRLGQQAMGALQGEFFDADVDEEVQPTRSLMRTDAKAVILLASRHQPPYRLRLEFSVRTDREDRRAGGTYEVFGEGIVWCEPLSKSEGSDFQILPSLRSDGLLELNEDQLRSQVALAIRLLGKMPKN